MTYSSPTECPPLSAVLYWEIAASYYQPPQKIPFINGTLLSEIICMTLTHQCFHFWSPASRLFASVSPLCDWAICQKKRALVCYFRVRMGVFILSKLKFRQKIPQRNSLELSLFTSSKSHRMTTDSLRELVLPSILFYDDPFTGIVKYLSTNGTLDMKRKLNSHYPDGNSN